MWVKSFQKSSLQTVSSWEAICHTLWKCTSYCLYVRVEDLLCVYKIKSLFICIQNTVEWGESVQLEQCLPDSYFWIMGVFDSYGCNLDILEILETINSALCLCLKGSNFDGIKYKKLIFQFLLISMYLQSFKFCLFTENCFIFPLWYSYTTFFDSSGKSMLIRIFHR